MKKVITIEDLNIGHEIDQGRLTEIKGGKLRFFNSTADLHRWIYGDESPYGRGSTPRQIEESSPTSTETGLLFAS